MLNHHFKTTGGEEAITIANMGDTHKVRDPDLDERSKSFDDKCSALVT
jgi:hypothetical protein